MVNPAWESSLLMKAAGFRLGASEKRTPERRPRIDRKRCRINPWQGWGSAGLHRRGRELSFAAGHFEATRKGDL